MMMTPKIEPWMEAAAREVFALEDEGWATAEAFYVVVNDIGAIIARHAEPVLAAKDAEIARLTEANKIMSGIYQEQEIKIIGREADYIPDTLKGVSPVKMRRRKIR